MTAAEVRPRMGLVSFKPLVRGGLRGFCTVSLPCGLIIHGVDVFMGKKGAFAALKPVLDRDGRHHAVDGAKQYIPVAECAIDLTTRFSAAVVELVRSKYADALDDEAAL